jgi:hypothetical protein
MLLVLGAVEFGRLMWTFGSVETASREAARYGSAVGDPDGDGVLKYQDCDAIRDAGQKLSTLALANDAFEVSYDDGDGGFVADCPEGDAGPEVPSGHRIVVTVTTSFDSILPFVNLDRATIQSTDRRSIIIQE